MKNRPFKHLILISIDNLRQDALSSSQDKRYLVPFGLENAPATPHLDSYAKEGFVFSHCRAPSSSTPTSHASMLTGLFPPQHGVRLFFHNQLAPSVKTIFDFFKADGFDPVACVDFIDLFKALKLTAAATVLQDHQQTLKTLKKRADSGKRVAAFFHLIDPHYPYGLLNGHSKGVRSDNMKIYNSLADKLGLGPSKKDDVIPRLRKTVIQKGISTDIGLPLYIQGVNQFDQHRFARLMENLEETGLLKDSLVVITSDHGEASLKGVESRPADFFHGDEIKEELIRVPLIFWSRHFKNLRHRVSQVPTSLVDILPTVMSLMGLTQHTKNAENLDGIDRSALILNNKSAEARKASRPSPCYTEAIFEDRSKWNHRSKHFLMFLQAGKIDGQVPHPPYKFYLNQSAVYQDDYKLRMDADQNLSLFDLKLDPFETRNLLDQSALYGLVPFIKDYELIALKMKKLFPTDAKEQLFSKTSKEQLDSQYNLAKQMMELGY